MCTGQGKNIHSSVPRAQYTKVTLTRLALAIPASPFSTFPPRVHPYFNSGTQCSLLLSLTEIREDI